MHCTSQSSARESGCRLRQILSACRNSGRGVSPMWLGGEEHIVANKANLRGMSAGRRGADGAKQSQCGRFLAAAAVRARQIRGLFLT